MIYKEIEILMSKLSAEQLFDTLMGLLETTSSMKHENLVHKFLPDGGGFDDCGNYWIQVGNETDSSTLFCCHMDTVGSEPKKTDPIYYQGFIYAMSNDTPCLGGDDRCGMLVLMALINAGVNGTYVFHMGEEKGAVGSSFIAKKYDLSRFKRTIEFDRRGTNSVITVMMGAMRTCSDEFATALIGQLNLDYKIDDTGVFTDVFEYRDTIAECTNLSVGYFHEHTSNEKINADWLINQFIPALYNVDWENLPTIRDPKEEDFVFGTGSWVSGKFRGSKSTYTYGDYADSRSVKKDSKSEGSGNIRHSSKSDTFIRNGEGYLNYYNSERNYADDRDDSNTDLQGLSVFDEKQISVCCSFCACHDESIDEYLFDGKFWTLCLECKNFLQLEDELRKNNEVLDPKLVQKVLNNNSDKKLLDVNSGFGSSNEDNSSSRSSDKSVSFLDIADSNIDADWDSLDFGDSIKFGI